MGSRPLSKRCIPFFSTTKDGSPQQIAKVLLISDQAVREHVQEYRESNKLKPVSGGSKEKLSEEQSKKLAAHLESYTYLYVKDIAAYVQATFGIAYSVPGITHWLRRHRFSYKKPAVVPGKANLEQQQAWLAEYEKLRRGLLENETIGFIDRVHPTHNVQPAFRGVSNRSVIFPIPRSRISQKVQLLNFLVYI